MPPQNLAREKADSWFPLADPRVVCEQGSPMSFYEAPPRKPD
jgi:hypothetical protein